jgi:hypothetical protein
MRVSSSTELHPLAKSVALEEDVRAGTVSEDAQEAAVQSSLGIGTEGAKLQASIVPMEI